MKTPLNNGQILALQAEQLGIPLRTLEQVSKALQQTKKNKADVSLARLMLRAGRLTDEASASDAPWAMGNLRLYQNLASKFWGEHFAAARAEST